MVSLWNTGFSTSAPRRPRTDAMEAHRAVHTLVAHPKLIRDALVPVERMRFVERSHLVLPEGLVLLGLDTFIIEGGPGSS
jgi:hypothetical protein